MAHHRRPHPYAAWPHRPHCEEGDSETESFGGSFLVRSDPTMLPMGAREKRTEFPDAPSRFYNTEPALSQEELKKAAKDKRLRSQKMSSWVEKVLKELEPFFPRVRPFRELYGGQKFIQVQFSSAPQSFYFGMLPTRSALWGAAVNFFLGFVVRTLAAWMPIVSRAQKEVLLNYTPLQGPFASIVLFFVGALTSILVRNRFSTSRLFSLAFFAASLVLAIVSDPGIQSSALPWLVGHWLGSFVDLSLGVKPAAKTQPKPLVTGPQPVAWAAERWMPAFWEIKLETGWARFPPVAEDKLERAHQAHAGEVILQNGDFGEQRYTVDLLNGIAKTTINSQDVKRLVRRSPVNY